MKRIVLVSAIPAIVISLACGGQQTTFEGPSPVPTPVPSGPAASGAFVDAPELGVTDWIRGEAVDLDTADGVVLVEHWATWCGPCRIEFPHLTALQEEHGDRLTVIGLSDEPKATVEPFVRRNEEVMGYTVAAADPSAMMAWSRLANADSIPYSYLVVNGQIVWHGHPARMAPVLPVVLDGSWTPEMARTLDELPAFVPAYLETLSLTGKSAALALVEPLLETPGIGGDTKNELAWTILTEVPEAQRDVPLAVRLGEQATDSVEHGNWAYEDTLGLAYFYNGQQAQAIEAQERAVILCNEAQAGHPCIELADRLTAFRDGRSGM